MRKWIETDRAGLRTHLRLTEAAKEWADAAARPRRATLYTGARLAVASEWAASHRDELGALEAAFLSASQEHERQKQADEAEKNRRLAEASRGQERGRSRPSGRSGKRREAQAASVRAEDWRPGHQKKLSQRFLIAAAVSLLLAIAAVWVERPGEQGDRAEAKTSRTAANEKESETIATKAERETSERNERAGEGQGTDRDLAAARRPLRVGAEQAPGPFAPPGGRSPPDREHLRGTR